MKKSTILAVVVAVMGLIGALRAGQTPTSAAASCCDGGACCNGGACCDSGDCCDGGACCDGGPCCTAK